MQLNFRDLITVGLLVAAFVYGKPYLEGLNKPATPTTPTVAATVPGTPANFGIACAGLADNIVIDGKVLRPVVLYSIDAQEAIKSYFDRPFAANIKANQSALIAKLIADVSTTCGDNRAELSTEKRAALVKLLQDTAAANK